MGAVLITGMSGAGKSTVLDALSRRGHRVLDTDDSSWSEEVPLPDGTGVEQLWHEGPMTRLLAAPVAGSLFVSGCVRNQVSFYDRFDAVVLLSAPVDVMLARLAARDTKPFGRSPADRARILGDLEAVEPLLRRSATVEISTDRPLDDVVAAVEAAAGPSTSRELA